MRLGRLLIILAIVLIGGVAALFFLLRGSTGGDEAATPEPEVLLLNIISVGQPIARGEIITEVKLDTIAILDEEFIPDIMFIDLIDVVGYRARFDLDQAVPLTRGMLVESLEGLSEIGSDASLLIPENRVAISIPMNRFSGVAYGLRRGDHVNVLVTMLFVDLDTQYQTLLPNTLAGLIAPGPNVLMTIDTEEETNATLTLDTELFLRNLTAQSVTGGSLSPLGRVEFDAVFSETPYYIVPSEPQQRPRMVSQTLLQDVIVLNVGNFPQPTDEEEEIIQEPEPVEGEEPQPAEAAEEPPPAEGEEVVEEVVQLPDIITLIVTPQEAVTLNYLMLSGADLNIVMRASGDDSRINTDSVTLQYLLDNYNILVPAQLPYGFEPAVNEIINPAMSDLLESLLIPEE
ncbi:MAG: hypothetical protein FVQ83_08015 [Chloroflexi bacterium]|nr:hypothetical protein [Chloroflexota bacterium]